jgi:hypothetical protein
MREGRSSFAAVESSVTMSNVFSDRGRSLNFETAMLPNNRKPRSYAGVGLCQSIHLLPNSVVLVKKAVLQIAMTAEESRAFADVVGSIQRCNIPV